MWREGLWKVLLLVVVLCTVLGLAGSWFLREGVIPGCARLVVEVEREYEKAKEAPDAE